MGFCCLQPPSPVFQCHSLTKCNFPTTCKKQQHHTDPIHMQKTTTTTNNMSKNPCLAFKTNLGGGKGFALIDPPRGKEKCKRPQTFFYSLLNHQIEFWQFLSLTIITCHFDLIFCQSWAIWGDLDHFGGQIFINSSSNCKPPQISFGAITDKSALVLSWASQHTNLQNTFDTPPPRQRTKPAAAATTSRRGRPGR